MNEEQAITLEYDLFDLPTAQHKAGLAGLLLMIESMKMRKLSLLPEVKPTTATSAGFVFTKDSMQKIFDDLYDASWVEVQSKQKWQGKDPKKVLEVEPPPESEGKKKKEKYYVYDAVQPKGDFLKAFYPDDSEAWLKLWRDMLWNTLRGKPLTRGVYEERACEQSSSIADTMWNNLLKAKKEQLKGKSVTDSIAGSLFIGAQDVNAERVPFKGTIEQNFLLHFWPVAALIYVPQRLTIEGKLEYAGYASVIPEPADLKSFIEDARQLLRSLKTVSVGLYPKSALIDLPEEGGLEYIYHLARSRIDQMEISYSLAAVEIYHLEKKGNNIRLLTAERIVPNKNLLNDYEILRQICRHPLYKAQRIHNLLAGKPWYADMDAVFNSHPWPFFIQRQGKTNNRIPFFGLDARKDFLAIERKLKVIEDNLKLKSGGKCMSEGISSDQLAKIRDKQLPRRIYGLIRAYVNHKTEVKSGKKYEDFKNNKDNRGYVLWPKEYREAREKVCTDAFLAMRGRREQDFVEYFTGTICSIPQYLPEEDYLIVTDALISDWEKVKTLSMLALSAHSYLGESKDGKEKGGE
jgi:CRISPR-associated protein Cmx8